MKERLTGAIILVALMVLLVPELLTGPIRSAPRTAAAAPSAEGAPLRSYTINLSGSDAPGSGTPEPTPLTAAPPAPPPVEAAPPPTALSAADGASAAPQSAHPAEPPRASGDSALAAPGTAGPATAGPATASPAGSGAGAWAVQLGSFAQHANAERLAREVRAQGFKVSISQESSGRHLYRVRVGPAHDRAAAGALASQLQAAGHRGAVVSK